MFTKFNIRYLSTLSFLCVIVFSISPAHAVVLFEKLDRHLVENSQLIVLGTVEEIQFRSSEPVENQEIPIPHTFVTIAIEEILKGYIGEQQHDNFITIRQEGGDTEDGETFMVIRGQPLFDIGDRGVFFIHHNGQSVVPLVGWRQGFIRILEDGELVINDVAAEMVFTENPINAAGIHPLDIKDYGAFIERLRSQDNPVVTSIIENMSEQAHELMEIYPEQLQELEAPLPSIPPEMREQFTGNNPFLAPSIDELMIPQEENPIGDWPVPDNFLRELYPDEYKAHARNLFQSVLTRDLNILLMRQNIFPTEMINTLDPQPRNEGLVYTDPSELSLPEIALRNRRIMEAAFNQTMVKSLDRSMVRGSYNPHPEIMLNEFQGGTFEMFMPEEPESEGPQPQPEPLPEDATPVNEGTLIEHIFELVQVVHTNDELEFLEPVPSLNPEFAFEPNLLETELPPLPYDIPEPQPQTEEQQLLQENEGNPVIQ